MSRHRFANRMQPASQPGAVATTAVTGAFVLCPMALRPATTEEFLVREQLFARAFREAQAVVSFSRLERLQTVSVN